MGQDGEVNKMEKIDWTGRIRQLIIDEIEKRKPRKFATTRAVYYFLGSQNEIPLTVNGYKKLNALTVDMRKKGEIPWGYFPVIRGSNGRRASEWISPEENYNMYKDWFLGSANNYVLPRWLNQSYHVEVWVEKLGLLPDIEYAVSGLDIQCRAVEGFPPWEFVYENLESIKRYLADRQENAQFVILYFGDLDPSGRDIPRQLEDAFTYFNMDVELRWVGILPEHVRKYNLPQIPLDPDVIAKIHRDSRYAGYMQWLSEQGIDGEMFAELDAWNGVFPTAIRDEIRPVVEEYFDDGDDYEEAKTKYEENKVVLEKLLEKAREKLEED
jgi:hypothetical protein